MPANSVGVSAPEWMIPDNNPTAMAASNADNTNGTNAHRQDKPWTPPARPRMPVTSQDERTLVRTRNTASPPSSRSTSPQTSPWTRRTRPTTISSGAPNANRPVPGLIALGWRRARWRTCGRGRIRGEARDPTEQLHGISLRASGPARVGYDIQVEHCFDSDWLGRARLKSSPVADRLDAAIAVVDLEVGGPADP